MSSPLFFFSYASNATHLFSPDELVRLLAKSRERNAEANVTGLLLYRGGNFIQALEGPEDAVRATVARIERDPRHAGIIPLWDGTVEERVFGNWSMGFDELVSMPPLPQGGGSDFLTRRDAQAPDAHEVYEFFRSFRENMR